VRNKFDRSTVVLSPLAPQPTGNGLAMRVATVVDAAAADRPVVVVVVPVAGEPPEAGGPVSGVPVIRLDPAAGTDRRALVRLLAQPAWRDRLAAAGEWPEVTRAAPPTLAEAVVGALGDASGWAVHVVRAGLAPLGVAVAELIESPCLTLDLDDDDETLLRRLGRPEEADAYGRLLAAFAPSFAGIWLAADTEAAAVSARLGVPTATLPNAVRLPERPARSPAAPPDLLFVGNLTYPPNVEAARTLAEQILPAVRRRTGLPVTATIAGAHDRDPAVTGLARHEGVVVPGFVPDLAGLYAAATACVVALAHGGGTRIKLLEAFAHGVPVVATPAAFAGLGVEPDVHLLGGDSPDVLAGQVAELLADPARGGRIAAAARRFVERHHAAPVVGAQVRELLDAAAGPTALSPP
jgi:glycosyltransferase involved in cell wall biosynthesis